MKPEVWHEQHVAAILGALDSRPEHRAEIISDALRTERRRAYRIAVSLIAKDARAFRAVHEQGARLAKTPVGHRISSPAEWLDRLASELRAMARRER